MTLGPAHTVTPDKQELSLSISVGGVSMANKVAVVSGSTETWDFTLEVDGSAYNYTGYTSLTLRRKRYPDGRLDSTTTAGLLSVLSASAGTFRLSPDDAWWSKSADYYDLEVAVVLSGKTVVFPDPANGPLRVEVSKGLV